MPKYAQVSRSTPFGLLLVVPVWAVYELLTFHLNGGLSGPVRTGVDLLFSRLLQNLSLPPALTVALPIAVVVLYFARNHNRAVLRLGKARYIGYMCLESLAYGLLFGVVVGSATGLVLTPALPQAVPTNRLALLSMNLGAGIYEEFLFRLIVLSGVVAFLRRSGVSNNHLVVGSAILISAVTFSWFHYLNVFGETFNRADFIFRLIAGVAFSGLFLVRGYGIAACTHSFYNIFLMLRGG